MGRVHRFLRLWKKFSVSYDAIPAGVRLCSYLVGPPPQALPFMWPFIGGGGPPILGGGIPRMWGGM